MNTPHYRHEFKYLITSAQIPLLQSRISSTMRVDLHAGPNHRYGIRSLYFDDEDNRCFFENENGTDPREKYRIRIYNHSSTRITLECKRKEHGKTLKSACPLSLEQAECLIQGASLPEIGSLPPLLRKLELERKLHRMHPVIIVEYERIPYIRADGNVRVTFDMNIGSCSDPTQFFVPEIPTRPVMPVGQHLMEVKYDTFLPDYTFHSLNLGQLSQTTFSKYYLCRKYSMRWEV